MKDSDLSAWLQARLPTHLMAIPPDVHSYDDEIVIMLQLAHTPERAGLGDVERRTAEQELIARQRELTRPLRMQLAREIQAALDRPVAWGMRVGGSESLFSSRSTPVMTRLGRAERGVLDTLVAAGVAETRSAALAYVVRAFATEHEEWLAEMRAALAQIHELRSQLKLTRRSGAPSEAPHPAADAEAEG